jgi:hypothetical protein
MTIQHIFIYPCQGCIFSYSCGGMICSYEMAKNLSQYIETWIYSAYQIQNDIYNNVFTYNILNTDLNARHNIENTLVIYGETVEGNPLGAKYIVRWILAPLYIHARNDIYTTWNKNDLVYFFNNELKLNDKPQNIVKFLTTIYINPNLQNRGLPRSGSCHTFRKSNMHNNINFIHSSDSYIIHNESQDELIQIFNDREIFISYDPLTFLTIIAALCGCISIVYKVDGLSKEEWIENTAIAKYLKFKNEPLYGIAYGLEEVEFAKQTVHLVKQQWSDFQSFLAEQTIVPFLTDIKNIDNICQLQNTVENVYCK